MSINKRIFLYTLLFFAFSWALLIGAFSPLLFNGIVYHTYLEVPLHFAYKGICHTIPDKCIDFAGTRTLACSRCVGIYSASALVFSAILLFALLKLRFFTKLLFGKRYYYFFFVLAPIHFVLLQFHLIIYDKVTAFSSGFISSLFFIHYIYVLYLQNIKD